MKYFTYVINILFKIVKEYFLGASCLIKKRAIKIN